MRLGRSATSLSAEGVSLLLHMQRCRLDVREASDWPGTTLLFGATAQVHRFRFDAESIDLFRTAVDGLYEWLHPDTAEDLCLYSASGEPVLVSVAHERESWIVLSEATDGELAARWVQMRQLTHRRE